jgi:hypothetical protein
MADDSQELKDVLPTSLRDCKLPLKHLFLSVDGGEELILGLLVMKKDGCRH